MDTKFRLIICILALPIVLPLSGNTIRLNLPKQYNNLVESITIPCIGNAKPKIDIKEVDTKMLKVELEFTLDQDIIMDDWRIDIQPAFAPTFNWQPHLTPTKDNVVDQHVFRSPAIIATNNVSGLVIIPDLDILDKANSVRWYLDADAQNNILSLGMADNTPVDHILFEKTGGSTFKKGKLKYGFYILKYDTKQELDNPFRKPLDFFWTNWGHSEYKKGNPHKTDMEAYVKHTYNWAFNTWSENVWQEFTVDGKKVGAPVFIVNTTQSPNYPGEVNEREFRSIWNQAWFSSLRSASGVYRYARRTNNAELKNKALLTKELALSFPRKEGFFYGLVCTEMEQIEINGEKYNRSKGWDYNTIWGNSNRNPLTWDASRSPFHVLDMSWTALLMLRWYDELEKDERLLEYASTYAQALLKQQDTKGFFPGWLDIETLEKTPYLNQSPETSMSVTFLLKMYELTKEEVYKAVAIKAMNAVIAEVIPEGRWEDFETYWSCSRYGTENLVGKKVERNNMYKQCNFSMFWTAEALFESYKVTGDEKYLKQGQRVLDELLMTQASWQPSYIYVNALGGFGVMNADCEWNDSRETLFSEIILQYGMLLKSEEYIERGVTALKAGFSMMYCPENPRTKVQWEKAWPFLGEMDYGFTMENYGHHGRTSPEGEGVGEFTIYDWGNGAASEAYNRIVDKFGKEILK